MGQSQSKETVTELTPDEMQKAEFLRERFEEKGLDGILNYVSGTLNNWENEVVNIGVLGRYKTGKSTFINAVLGLQSGQPGASKTGPGNTTCQIERYQHQKNSQIVLYDFPGVGTPEFPKETYMKNVKISECDYYLIFFDAVISEDSIWLAKNLLAIGKPFCFVRSLIDQDLANAEFDGQNSSYDEVIADILKRATETISENALIKTSSIFFISGRYTHIGEFDKLLNLIQTNLSPLKLEAFVFSVSSEAREMIEKKYLQLKGRVKNMSLVPASVSAVPVPGVDMVVNIAIIVKEIKHYIKTFNLHKDKIVQLISN